MFNFKRVISTVLAISMCLGIGQSLSTNAYTYTEGEAVKIMCVGDSITDGYGLQGSYRKYLYNNLVANGYSVDMVGAYGSNEETYYNGETTLSYDGNYTAISGYAIQNMSGKEYRSGIYETIRDGNIMANCQPDIVLLQIGTNDVISDYNDGIIDRLEVLVDYLIDNMDEDGVVFVTTIPYMDATNNEVYSWFAHYDDYYQISQAELAQEINNCVDSYNAQIKAMVERKISEGCTNIQFADVNSVVDSATELRDGVHPNDKGYQDMGEYWCNVLTSYLSSEPTTPDVTTTTTTTTTTEEVTTTTTQETTTEEVTTTTEVSTNWWDAWTETTTTTDSDTEVTTTPEEVTTTTTEASTNWWDTWTETTTTTNTDTEVTTTPEDIPNVTEYPLGDINKDGYVNAMDLLLLKKRVLNNVDWSIAWNIDWTNGYDINGDGNVNIVDVILLKKILLTK